MVMPRLEVHYSVLYLIARMMLCVGFALAFLFIAGHTRFQNWFIIIGYVVAAICVGVALTCAYRLLTARGPVVVLVDASGFKDARLTPTVIPWSAIQSVSPYIPHKSRNPTGVALVIDPAFKRGLAIRLSAKLLAWANLDFGSVVRLDTSILDVDCFEISRVAGSYISRKP